MTEMVVPISYWKGRQRELAALTARKEKTKKKVSEETS